MTESITIPESTDDPRVKPVAKEVTDLTSKTEDFSIVDAESYEHGAEFLRLIKTMQNDVETKRKKITVPLDQAKKEVMDLFRPLVDSLTDAEKKLKRRMVTWKDEQDRIAREAQRKAEERARKERERLEREANRAESDGRHGRAETLRERAEFTVPDVPLPTAPKVAGVSDRKVMQFEIIDPKKIPREFLMPDEKRIRRYVNAMRTDAEISGVRIWEESSLAARKA